jgi:hypothetical protein
MLTFHASIHGGVPTAPGPLSVTFDEGLAALERLDRLFIEPDGSFVWRGALADGGVWQVDGNLIDRGDCLSYVELKGSCATEQFDMLLAAFGWPSATIIFQLPLQGEYLDESAFRQMAASEAGAI